MLIGERNGLLSGLPYDAEVEYLESTGTQWIDTGYRPNSITEISIVYKPEYYDTTFRCVYGVQASTGSQRFYLVLSGSNAYKIQISSVANGSSFCGFYTNGTLTDSANGDFAPDNRRVSVVVNNPQKKVVLNGVEYAMPSWWGVNLYCQDSLALFGRKSGGAIQTANLFLGKIEGCNISEDGSLVHDFIPVRKGTVGYLYDRVSGKLFRNQGTGDFVIGPDKVSSVGGGIILNA